MSGSRDRCSAGSVGPKSWNLGSWAGSRTRALREAGLVLFGVLPPCREIDKLGPSTRCHKALIYLTQYHEAITIPEAQGQHLLSRCQTYLLYPTFPRRPTVQRGLVFPIRSWPSVRLASSFPSFGRSGALLCPKWKWGRRCGTGGPAGGRTEQASGAGFGGPVCPEPGA